MQSIAGACQFSAKKEGHRSAAEQYNNLIVKTKFEIEMPNEENFADDLEKMILDIQSKCNFFPPQFIVDEYDAKHGKYDGRCLGGLFGGVGGVFRCRLGLGM